MLASPSHSVGATWTSTHVFGEGEKNDAAGRAYYHVQKCASQWMHAYLVKLGEHSAQQKWAATNFTHEDLSHYVTIVIVRDPLSRWLSVCPAREKIPLLMQNPVSVKMLFDNLHDWMLDEHLAPQTDFVAGLDLTSARFFWCDQDLSANLQHFFQQCGLSNTAPPPIVNQQSQDPHTLQAVLSWTRLLAVPENQQRFREAYRRDYEFIDNVTFYTRHHAN